MRMSSLLSCMMAWSSAALFTAERALTSPIFSPDMRLFSWRGWRGCCLNVGPGFVLIPTSNSSINMAASFGARGGAGRYPLANEAEVAYRVPTQQTNDDVMLPSQSIVHSNLMCVVKPTSARKIIANRMLNKTAPNSKLQQPSGLFISVFCLHMTAILADYWYIITYYIGYPSCSWTASYVDYPSGSRTASYTG